MGEEKKAYDIKALLERLKGRGLDLAESAGVILVEETFGWLDESAVISKTPYDDMARVIYPQLKSAALAAVDKIDGQVG